MQDMKRSTWRLGRMLSGPRGSVCRGGDLSSGAQGLRASAGVCLTLMLLVAAVMLSPSRGHAQPTQAKVYLVQDPIPPRVSAKKLVSFARGKHKRVLGESKDKDIQSRTWTADAIVVFNRPIQDYEFELRFRDMEKGSSQQKTMVIMTGSPDEKIFVQKVRLDRRENGDPETFRGNTPVLVDVLVKHRKLGSTKIKLGGETFKRTSNFTFSDKEASQGR